jgi:hypothetical protein
MLEDSKDENELNGTTVERSSDGQPGVAHADDVSTAAQAVLDDSGADTESHMASGSVAPKSATALKAFKDKQQRTHSIENITHQIENLVRHRVINSDKLKGDLCAFVMTYATACGKDETATPESQSNRVFEAVDKLYQSSTGQGTNHRDEDAAASEQYGFGFRTAYADPHEAQIALVMGALLGSVKDRTEIADDRPEYDVDLFMRLMLAAQGGGNDGDTRLMEEVRNAWTAWRENKGGAKYEPSRDRTHPLALTAIPLLRSLIGAAKVGERQSEAGAYRSQYATLIRNEDLTPILSQESGATATDTLTTLNAFRSAALGLAPLTEADVREYSNDDNCGYRSLGL